jgi:hypothetical protein
MGSTLTLPSALGHSAKDKPGSDRKLILEVGDVHLTFRPSRDRSSSRLMFMQGPPPHETGNVHDKAEEKGRINVEAGTVVSAARPGSRSGPGGERAKTVVSARTGSAFESTGGQKASDFAGRQPGSARKLTVACL